MAKNIRKIIAQALILTMVIPNVTINAFTNNIKDNKDISVEDTIIDNNDIKENDFEDLNKEEYAQDNTIEDIENEENNKNSIVEEKNEEEIDVVQHEKEVEKHEDKVEVDNLVNSLYDQEKVFSEENSLITASSSHDHDDEFCHYEREEFILKAQGLANYTTLIPKTDDNYEVALAYSDGSYRFVGSSDSYEQAMSILQTTPITASEEEITPVILNEYGAVVYATNYVARFAKNVNGVAHFDHIPYLNSKGEVDPNSCYYKNDEGKIVLRPTHPSISGTTNIYTDSSLKTAYTYINQNYIDDVPVIEYNDNAAKVLVNGYTGWINNKTDEETYNGKKYTWSDYLIIPVSQVTNPSYYIAQNGVLYHYISLDLKAAANTNGSKIAVGVAPSYLKEGIRYLSYDGNYFYEGSNISTALNNMINNLKSGNKNNAVNASKPYYSYYQYLPFRSKTVYTAEQLDKYINNNSDTKSKLRGLGQTLKDAEKKYGVNAILTLSVAINESDRGMSAISQSKNNLFGMAAYDSDTGQATTFKTAGESVIHFANEYISRGYADPKDWRYYGGHLGNKNLGANVKYASDPFWGEKAAKYALEIDQYLSGSNTELIDSNSYQIAIYSSTNEVKNSSGKILYNVDNYWAYVGTTFILTKSTPVTINGVRSYEIYPERNTAVTEGKFQGEYDWNTRGYIKASGITLINTQKDLTPPVKILGGASRFETAVELSKSMFTTADTVVLVNRDAIVDGIAATPLATVAKAPILYTTKDVLHEATKKEIIRLKAKKIIIVGGTGVVTNDVTNQLKNIGITKIDRLGGANRYDTALEVAKYIDKNYYDVSNVLIVNGNAEADAMSSGAVGGKENMPILLTAVDSMPSDTYNWLKSESISNAYIIGGTGVISDKVLNSVNTIVKNDIKGNRLGGANRQDTNAMIIKKFYGTSVTAIYAAKSHVLFDALAAGPIAALDKSPVVLVNDDINKSQEDVLSKMTATKIYQTGLDFSKKGIESLKRILKIYDL